MKNFLITLALIITIGLGVSQAQTYTDSWAFGFGGTYPRLVSVNVQPLNSNYGAFLSLQRNFSENVGLRLKVSYLHLEGKISPATDDLDKVVTNLLKGDLDVLYYLNPCEPISPYVFAGGSVGLRMLRENYATRYLDENETALALNLGVGVEWTIAPQWKILTEYGYHTLFNSELDGTIAPIPEEINGRDSYMTLNLGLLYYFGRGEPSKKCEPCRGLSMEMRDMTDYNKIENMIKQHIPKEVIKEVVVDKYIYAIAEDRLVLVGVNFAFDKSDLLPESYTVLDKAVKLLNDKPNVNVEIEGYTDYIGTADYNQKLSVERAQTVKDYLVFKGIAERRLSTIGYGKGNPVADNETEEGRAMNRRIVFRILK
jgi:OOP family OmpA-OmpF porin